MGACPHRAVKFVQSAGETAAAALWYSFIQDQDAGECIYNCPEGEKFMFCLPSVAVRFSIILFCGFVRRADIFTVSELTSLNCNMLYIYNCLATFLINVSGTVWYGASFYFYFYFFILWIFYPNEPGLTEL